jgi:hypothetical protein
MKKFIALFLVISFLGMNCATYERGEGINLSPDQKPGVKLVIQKTDGQQVRGELIAVKQNSLLLKESESGADVSVDIADIKTITIVKKSKVGKGAGFGFLGGASLGVVIGLASGDDPPGFMSYTAGDKAAFLGIAFGLIGMILGAAEGASAGADQKIQIEGKSDSEIKEILEDLREKARVPNFQ